MVDPIDASTWPCPRGPWPEVTDLSRLFDHGQRWCLNAAGHPTAEQDYPDAQIHTPWNECRTREWALNDARRDLEGNPLHLSVYGAAAFRFGQSRPTPGPKAQVARVVVETWGASPGRTEPVARFSLSAAQTRQLARVLDRVADVLTILI